MAHPAAQPQVIIEQSAAGLVCTGSTGQQLSPCPRLAPAARRHAVVPDRGPTGIAPVVSTFPCPAALAQAPNDATPRLPGRSSAAWPQMRARDAEAGRTGGMQMQVPTRARIPLRAKEAAQDAREDVAVPVGRLGGCFGWAHLRW